MNYDQRKILDEGDYFDREYLYYIDWYEYDYYYYYFDVDVTFRTLSNGLVDWSDEIPIFIKRHRKIDEILGNLNDKSNRLGNFWPKRQTTSLSNI